VVLAARRVERLKTCAPRSRPTAATPMWWRWTSPTLDSIRAAVAHAETEMGAIDILVNNSA
jgi:NADP-dependent 3-hydroxy acid dehydrogenase YdfG